MGYSVKEHGLIKNGHYRVGVTNTIRVFTGGRSGVVSKNLQKNRHLIVLGHVAVVKVSLMAEVGCYQRTYIPMIRYYRVMRFACGHSLLAYLFV